MMCRSRAGEPTVPDPLILETVGEYDVPVNQSIGFSGIYSANPDSLCKINASPEPILNSPSQLYSTSLFL